MELIDRYLKAVKDSLPAENRDDIIEELGSNIAAQIDEKEGELGRPLSESEQQAVLSQFGHPVLMAGRYRPDRGSVVFGRQIIGPELFPLYLKVLSLNMGIAVLVVAIIALLNRASLPVDGPSFVGQALMQFTIVTLVFALIQYHASKFPESWNPRSSQSAQHGAETTVRVSRVESVFGLIVLVVLNLWFLEILRSSSPIIETGAGNFTFAPAWHQLLVPYLVLVLVELVRHVVNFIHPDWMRFRSMALLTSYSIGLLLVCYLLLGGDSIVAVVVHPSGQAVEALRFINLSFFWSLITAAVINLFLGVWEVRRLILGSGRNSRSSSSTAIG